MAIALKSRNKKTIERDIKTILAKRKLKGFLLVTVTSIELTVTKSNGTTRIVQLFQLSAEINKTLGHI